MQNPTQTDPNKPSWKTGEGVSVYGLLIAAAGIVLYILRSKGIDLPPEVIDQAVQAVIEKADTTEELVKGIQTIRSSGGLTMDQVYQIATIFGLPSGLLAWLTKKRTDLKMETLRHGQR